MEYVVHFLAGAAFILFCSWQSNVFFNIAKRSVHLLDAYLAKGEEDDKLPMIEKRTGALFKSLLSLLLVLIIAIAIAGGLIWLADTYLELQSYNTLGSTWGIVALSVGATVPFFIPRKRKSDYSPLAQLLHHLALDNHNLGYRLFRREVKKQAVDRKEEFIIITGLARAGTTSMLNTLIDLGPFASLNYGNMPFVMSPNTWAKIYKPKGDKKKERSHGDGISIGLNSHEALEEYFFKAITNDSYIDEHALKRHSITHDQYEDYLDYQAIIRRKEVQIYLAKNNNFLLRYPSVRKWNASFRTIILFRHPLYHAASLMEKHRQFTEQQQEDPFIQTYMEWLGHHEFGAGHKPFVFTDEDEKALQGQSTVSLNYWLKVWIRVYQFAVTIRDEKTYFVSYDQFCSEPSRVLDRITKGLPGVNIPPDLTGHQNEREVTLDHDPDILNRALDVYEELRGRV